VVQRVVAEGREKRLLEKKEGSEERGKKREVEVQLGDEADVTPSNVR